MATKFITVSIEIMHDKNLTANQKFILAEIEQLTQLDKGCVASNQHFSELTGIAKETVSRAISDLEDKKYITTEIKNGTRNHVRIITILKQLRIDETSRPPKQNVKTPLTKHQETKENITSNKTINIDSFEKLWAEYGRVGSKSLAKKKYLTKSFSYTEQEVSLAITRYLKTVTDKKYQKHFVTFLNSISDWLEDYVAPINNTSFPKIKFSGLI